MQSHRKFFVFGLLLVTAALLASGCSGERAQVPSKTEQTERESEKIAPAGTLEYLWVPTKKETRSISAENPTGEKGKGAQAEPTDNPPARHLGKGWKARPFIAVSSKETATVASIEGPGIIRHIWMTLDSKFYRSAVLRMYWDGEENPSVEIPLGDFFACGHGLPCTVNSLMVAVNPSGGLNSYWPMPFLKSARITVTNDSDEAVPMLFYQITYTVKEELPHDTMYFHAQWRRENTTKEKQEYAILDNVQGEGTYAGTYLLWTQLNPFWWGEGEIKFFIDGDEEFPTIVGTGTEDYFGGAWAFNTTFSHIFTGYHTWLPSGAGQGKNVDPKKGVKHGLYRWHIPDPIYFKKDLKVTIQALGWNENGTFRPLEDDISSVAYWYQTEPHIPFPPLLSLGRREPR